MATLAAAMGMLILLMSGGASAQSPSPPTSSCTSVLVSLSPCLKYISGNESAAPASCCSQLGKVVQSDPQCLCVALNADTAALGLNINRTRALGLPDECKVKTPAVSDCKKGAAAGAPATSPAGDATPASGSTGSKTTPSTSFENAAPARGPAGLVAGIVVAAVLALAAV